MFISRQLIYLQMQKTGSTHITKVLKKFCGGNARAKHEQLTDYAKYRNRLIVASVRNPWDWYVSLGAYGCAGSGGLSKYLTHAPISEIRHAARHRDLAGFTQSALRLASRIGRRPDWKALYADASNEANFRVWLRLMLGPEGLFISKEGYAASPIKSVAGFMTFRFLALTTEYSQWNAIGRGVTKKEDVIAFADRNNIATRILRMESLNEDLLGLLQSMGRNVTLADLEEIEKTNTSAHRKYISYYDDETHALVAERDRFIIDRFGYQLF